jgi:hypothetical protein
LKGHHKQLEQVICEQLQQVEIYCKVPQPVPEQEHQHGQQKGIDHPLYCYNGNFWQAPSYVTLLKYDAIIVSAFGMIQLIQV